jgi:uncharacterized membrane protein
MSFQLDHLHVLAWKLPPAILGFYCRWASMKLKIFIGAAALALTFFVAPPTWAVNGKLTNIKICNNFPHNVHYAIAYQESPGDWMTRGWLLIETGKCYFFDGTLSLPEFYYRAESDKYSEKGGLAEETWGNKGPTKSFCIDTNTNNSFNFWNAGNCKTLASFEYYSNGSDFSSDVDVSYTITFESNGTTTTNFDPLK